MKSCLSLLCLALVVAAASFLHADDPRTPGKNVKVTWKKIVVDKAFRAEGVAVVDVNKDGKKDIVTGDVWYEAPDWKMHELSKERRLEIKGWGNVIEKGYNPVNYSRSFAVFADDFNGDGYPDVIVIPFPGEPCFWYENPGSGGGLWKQHLLTESACNETPIYVDLFGKGKKNLVMGWQPPGSKGNMGEMCWFEPGKDPTQPWVRHSISGPSAPGKEVPGTQRFSHGLGHGDVNGDGRVDIICTGGWWEQPPFQSPASREGDDVPWKFHPANLSNGCADMHVYDVDGDGKGDIICSAPHWYGLFWFQAKSGPELSFLQRELLPMPATLAKEAADRKFLGKEEAELYSAINKLRDGFYRKAHLVAQAELSRMARDHAQRSLSAKEGEDVNIGGDYKGKIVNVISIPAANGKPEELARIILDKAEKGILRPGFEIGIGFAQGEGDARRYTVVIGDRGLFSLPSATHALHCVDINGDGLKDLVTGRRYWAHAPNPKGGGGDQGVNDPAFLYWFEAKKSKEGGTTFLPHEIDDDSGVGTQFAIEDINGDGLPDIIICNKRGLFVFLQVRVPVDAVPPSRNE